MQRAAKHLAWGSIKTVATSDVVLHVRRFAARCMTDFYP